jgi:hypothetical protein
VFEIGMCGVVYLELQKLGKERDKQELNTGKCGIK